MRRPAVTVMEDHMQKRSRRSFLKHAVKTAAAASAA
jgi:hypothetical protein